MHVADIFFPFGVWQKIYAGGTAILWILSADGALTI